MIHHLNCPETNFKDIIVKVIGDTKVESLFCGGYEIIKQIHAGQKHKNVHAFVYCIIMELTCPSVTQASLINTAHFITKQN